MARVLEALEAHSLPAVLREAMTLTQLQLVPEVLVLAVTAPHTSPAVAEEAEVAATSAVAAVELAGVAQEAAEAGHRSLLARSPAMWFMLRV